MKTVFAPDVIVGLRPWVFLAGSIENGKASPWQQEISTLLKRRSGTILNPRRPNWNPNIRQSIEDEDFREQVEWELEAQEECDHIIMYFDPKTRSPISLLELGLFAESGKLLVCCPDGFWRKGNIEIVCDRYNIPLEDSFESLKRTLISWRPSVRTGFY